jgi:hypothetical protein
MKLLQVKTSSAILVMAYLVHQFSFAQTTPAKLLHGKIRIESYDLSGINIVNLNTDKATVTNSDGEFFIATNANDVLVFTANHLESIRKVIRQEDLNLDVVYVAMIPKVTVLKPVVINSNAITALSERIVAKEPKKYTVAERRLRTAGDFKPIMLLNLLGGVMPLDPVINKINGRTKRLKKLVALEKKEKSIKIITEWYEQDYFTTQLGIPAAYVSGFKYYLVEHEAFLKVLESQDKEEISFYMVGLAEEYTKLLSNEIQTGLSK